jgi:hypothetical protein
MRRYWPVIKRIVVIQTLGVALSLTCALSAGCATSAYMKDRMRDGADVFTASVGVGCGGKVRVGPAQMGLFDGADYAGLRGGRFYSGVDLGKWFDICVIVVGIEDFKCMDPVASARYKEFETTYCLVPLSGMVIRAGPTLNASYWTQIEAVLAVGGSLRLGFNPGELLDFILGWVAIDIYGDDIEARKQEEESNKASDATSEPAPGAGSSAHQR